jgi:hypothetical protein
MYTGGDLYEYFNFKFGSGMYFPNFFSTIFESFSPLLFSNIFLKVFSSIILDSYSNISKFK